MLRGGDTGIRFSFAKFLVHGTLLLRIMLVTYFAAPTVSLTDVGALYRTALLRTGRKDLR